MSSSDDRHVEASLLADGPLWLPELTGMLAARQWSALAAGGGLDPVSYGTGRVKVRRSTARREVACVVDLPTSFDRPEPLRLEVLDIDASRPYHELGLTLADAKFVSRPIVTGTLIKALAVFEGLPDLARTLGLLVHSLHVLVPTCADYDVSYSDPEVPFSIFVGVADTVPRNAALRVAEGFLHEAMHLQLSLIEDITPLVVNTGEKYYSPWQLKLRPPQGILHGLYVFAVIRDFMFALLQTGALDEAGRRHAINRITECECEILQAGTSLSNGRSLTPLGNRLLHRLRRCPPGP